MEIFGIISGFFLGLLAGLLPGLHSNTIAAIMLKTDFGAFFSAAAIASMAASHSVFEFIPAIFLFIPDSETVVSVLPGHRLLMKGRGAYALSLCAFSALFAAGFSLLLLPVAYFAMPVIYSAIEPHILWIVLLACVFLIASERKAREIALALGVFLLSGLLGLFALEAPILRDPLLPVFSGLFASAGILLSLREGGSLPKQIEEKIEISTTYLPCVLAGVVLGMLSDLLPGISTPAQIAVFASAFLYLNAPRFLALVASIGVSHSLFALVATAAIGKARTGSSIAIRELIGASSLEQTGWLIGISILSIAIAVMALLLLSKRLAGFLSRMPMQEIGLLILAYLGFLVFLFDGPMGLLVMATATAIGVIPPLVGVRRTHLMGCILVPSIVSMSGFGGVFLSLVLG